MDLNSIRTDINMTGYFLTKLRGYSFFIFTMLPIGRRYDATFTINLSYYGEVESFTLKKVSRNRVIASIL